MDDIALCAMIYDWMIILALIGVAVNFAAAWFTKDGDSLNQKAVNLHTLEDVLGWVVVLVGAIVMRFTDFTLIDPIMSLGVAIFILISAVKNLKEAIDLFLEKAPKNVDVEEIKEHLAKVDGVLNVHHVHIWSIDGYSNYATMHVVTNAVSYEVKERIREGLKEHGIVHATLELESAEEDCESKNGLIHHESHDVQHQHHHHH